MTKQNLVSKVIGVAGAGLIVSQSLLPAFAAISIQVTGNGYDADNAVNYTNSSVTTVVQDNDVDVKNDVNLDANTGDNTIKQNTGSDINVKTGDVDQDTEITTVAGSNSASVEDCGCETDVTVEVAKNGAKSDNTVNYANTTTKDLFQDNDVDVNNDVDQDANTGDNELEENTGGDLKLTTGDVEQDVTVHTEAGANAAELGSGNGTSELHLAIEENGAHSDNAITVAVENTLDVVQDNDVDVDTDVDVEAETGDNEIEENTGGDIDVETGDVDQDVEVTNAAGYNALAIDNNCCELDGDVVVDKNGAHADNNVNLALDFIRNFFQGDKDNDQNLDTDLDLDGSTGDNDVEENTGDDLTTGDVMQQTTVANEAGANVIGDSAHGNADVEISLSLLMSLLESIFG